MNRSDIVEFLELQINKEYVLNSFIFGSLAKGLKAPNDCDLFIVTNQTPNCSNWKNFIKETDLLKEKFEFQFGLKLNIIINTEKEFDEYSAFKERILNRPTIKIN